MKRIYQIAPDVVGIDSTFTYLADENLHLNSGDIVLVPFGSQSVVGVVIEETIDMPDFKLKEVYSKIEGISLPPDLMKTVEFVEKNYLCAAGAAIATVIPPGIRSRLQTWYEIESTGRIISEKNAIKEGADKATLKKWVANGEAKRFAKLPEKKTQRAKHFCLADFSKVDSYIEKYAKTRTAQIACLISLKNAVPFELSSEEVRTLTGVSDSTVVKLIEEELLLPVKLKPIEPSDTKLELTNEQLRALNEIQIGIDKGNGKFLLQGITGSGKTEVYLRAIEHAMFKGKTCLYVVPEISLTIQVVAQLKKRFGDSIAMLHSLMTDSERLSSWTSARTGKAKIVLGARSAIFAPLENIGLIVVDEEHETSYKQENVPRYHLRDVAEFRAKQVGAALVLGSATPSLESRYRAEIGELEHLRLNERATRALLPEVKLIDLRDGFSSLISSELKTEMQKALARGEQSLLFINRRAYSSALVCRDCGKSPKCPNCTLPLTFHRWSLNRCIQVPFPGTSH